MVHRTWDQIRERIERAEDVIALRTIRDQAHETYRDPLLFPDFAEFLEGLNRLHDVLIKRTIELAAMNIAVVGIQRSELPFAFLLFGSGGRREQTLWSDQDNGLVYADPRSEEEASQASIYFEKLAAEIHRCLFAVGYPPCSGEVLARNPLWRKPLGEYVGMVKGWMEEPDWERIRYLLIFADVRCIFGDEELAAGLSRVHVDYAKNHPTVLRAMLHNTLHHKVSMGIFGQLITERYGEDAGGVDVKYGAYIPIVNGIRLIAVQAGIAVSGTMERIDKLEELGAIAREQAAQWRESAMIALKLRSMTPYQIEDGMYTARGKLPAGALTSERRVELKRCLRIGRKLQRYVRQAVKGDEA